tara:strand:- start:415 stop:816 length:402 start_codon:yes stop_codon:yes gene_type:complete
MKRREIKFRAWDTINKKMIYGPTADNPSSSWILALPDDRFVKMQYTGLNDSYGHGKEIYEGDIVTGKYLNLNVEWGFKSIVCFDTIEDTDGYANGVILGWVTTNGSSLQDLVNGGGKIVGNKYENPDLLEEKQ